METLNDRYFGISKTITIFSKNLLLISFFYTNHLTSTLATNNPYEINNEVLQFESDSPHQFQADFSHIEYGMAFICCVNKH